ncbi:MAG: acyl-CoA dehydrogenase family protein [Pseudomonadota bacterium]
MSLPDRNNPYNFDEFLNRRDAFHYLRDDTFLQSAIDQFCGKQANAIKQAVEAIAERASFRWKKLADEIASPEKRVYLQHFDAHNRRVDRIVRPADALGFQKEIYSEALFSRSTPLWERFVKMFLIYQNGEANTACPLTCTEGLAELLDVYADTPELVAMRDHLQEGIDGGYAVGAQFISEIQGGSDIPEVRVEAVEEGGEWRLYGKKFFCSVAHADYAVVAAKPRGSESVAIFAVPAWLPGAKGNDKRNGCTIDRLKWKMGTCELPTAEITYDGAIAYPIGALDRGLANVVEIVLTYSRVTIGISSAATMTRAAREARQYAEFRQAFGRSVADFPIAAHQLDAMQTTAQRSTAGAFKLFGMFQRNLPGKTSSDKHEAFDVRELVMLQKITSSWDAVDVIRSAMSMFGGHGIMEDFSSLPRIFRDATVNELWEGPRNVLLWQIHRDLQKVASWYPPKEFVARNLNGADASIVESMANEMENLTAHPNLVDNDDATRDVCVQWDNFCHRFFQQWQTQALADITQL